MGDDDETKVPRKPKPFYRIGEVASLVGVEPHVLRYWEREFRTIRPEKSPRGQRIYSRRDVETLLRVRTLLYQEGFTIAGARRRLQQERSAKPQVATDGTVTETTARAAEGEVTISAAACETTASTTCETTLLAASDVETTASSTELLPAVAGAADVLTESEPAVQAAAPSLRTPHDELSLPLFTLDVERGTAAREARPPTRPKPVAEASDRREMRTALRDLRSEIEAFLDELG